MRLLDADNAEMGDMRALRAKLSGVRNSGTERKPDMFVTPGSFRSIDSQTYALFGLRIGGETARSLDCAARNYRDGV